ncbi:CBS domain-containing protein [Nitrospirota bacterium]
MLKASDIMQKAPMTINPEVTVEEIGRIFIEKNISGLPVVDASGTLVGVVTENDLISRNKQIHIPTLLRLFDAFIPLEGFKAFETEIKRISAKIAGDICTKETVTVTPETELDEIATIMTDKKIHHLPVMEGGKLVDIINQHDVLKGISLEGTGQ